MNGREQEKKLMSKQMFVQNENSFECSRWMGEGGRDCNNAKLPVSLFLLAIQCRQKKFLLKDLLSSTKYRFVWRSLGREQEGKWGR